MQVFGVGTTHNMGGKNGDKQTQERTWQDRRGMKREERTVKADGGTDQVARKLFNPNAELLIPQIGHFHVSAEAIYKGGGGALAAPRLGKELPRPRKSSCDSSMTTSNRPAALVSTLNLSNCASQVTTSESPHLQVGW